MCTPNNHVRRARRGDPVDAIDIEIDQFVGLASCGLDLAADGRIAQQSHRDLIELHVLAPGCREIRDLLLEHGSKIGRKCIELG